MVCTRVSQLGARGLSSVWNQELRSACGRLFLCILHAIASVLYIKVACPLVGGVGYGRFHVYYSYYYWSQEVIIM